MQIGMLTWMYCVFFILFKEISDNQAESNIPDPISQLMEYMMVDIDEDAEEISSRTLHLALQPINSAPKFVLGSSLTSQIKINSSQQFQKKTCAACRDAGCKQRDSCKGSGNRKWCTCVVTGLHGESKR